MPTWTLTDVDRHIHLDELQLGPRDVGDGCSVQKRTLRGGLCDGVDVVEIDNGAAKFTVLPTRGMGLWRAAIGELSVGWQAPVKGPVHPKFVPLFEPGGIGWLSGFDELLCRCGLESNGAPEFMPNGQLKHPLHGRIANLPAHQVEVVYEPTRHELAVSGTVDESRLFGNKLRLRSTYRTRAGEASITLIDEVTNLSAGPSELELLYHVNFGPPLAWEGSRLVAPVKKLSPRNADAAADVPSWDTYPAARLKPEVVHFFELAAGDSGRTRALLRNANGDRGVSLAWDVKQLPCFTLWKNPLPAADGYVTGLEPGINFPNVKSFEKEHGRVAVLAPGESRRYELTLDLHATAAAVDEAAAEIEKFSSSVKPTILSQPDADWAAP